MVRVLCRAETTVDSTATGVCRWNAAIGDAWRDKQVCNRTLVQQFLNGNDRLSCGCPKCGVASPSPRTGTDSSRHK